MISNQEVSQFVKHCESSLYVRLNNKLSHHIFRGISSLLWKNNPYTDAPNCMRQHLVFNEEKIIPKYCFDCYKIKIEPKTVIELLKLMLVFDRISLPDDNTRKCYVEFRPNVAGTYGGLIYFQALQDAKEALNFVTPIVTEQVSPDIQISIKRGCTDFSMAYPEYGELDSNNNPIMKYDEDWFKKETEFDTKGLTSHLSPLSFKHYNKGEFGVIESQTIFSWLRYAATIGDASYRELTNLQLPIITNLKRPKFQSN